MTPATCHWPPFAGAPLDAYATNSRSTRAEIHAAMSGGDVLGWQLSVLNEADAAIEAGRYVRAIGILSHLAAT